MSGIALRQSSLSRWESGGKQNSLKFIAKGSVKEQLDQSKQPGGQRELGISAAGRRTLPLQENAPPVLPAD